MSIYANYTLVCDRIFCNQCNQLYQSAVAFTYVLSRVCNYVYACVAQAEIGYFLLLFVGCYYTDILILFMLVCVCVNYWQYVWTLYIFGYHLKCNAMLSRCIVQGYTTIEYS
jgi:hypothetical protein